MADFKHPDTIAGIDKKRLSRDTRTTFQQIYEGVTQWDSGVVVLVVMALLPYFYSPIATIIVVPVSWFLYRSIIKNKANLTLPAKLPIDFAGETDYHDPKPGGKKFNKANGTIPFANLRRGAQELWFAGKDMLTHLMVIGTTGAGKTETLVSLAASSAFATGSGLIYVDAKAAPKLIAQFFTLARIFGREDDMRIINYMTGNKKVSSQSWQRLSNTTNPFALGSADSSVQMLTSLLPTGGGDNQVFLDRAISMVKGVMPALVELRDRGIMNITAEKIQQFIQLSVFINLAQDKLYLDRDGNPIAPEIATDNNKQNDLLKPATHPGYEYVQLSADSIKSVKSYLASTPGYSESAGARQPEEVAKQFGFGQMYFTRALSNLATTFGHIYQHELSEVDFADIIMNGRILIVLVPAMEQAGEERKALGKVILSCVRNAMALGLGNKAEGFREDVLESLPIDLKTPSVIIVDEYAEVATEGFAVTATQGRGLGMSVVFAGQDLAGFVRASKEEADMIFSNTRIKCLMALEDPELTWDRFSKLAGDMSVVSASGWERVDDGVDDWRPGRSASVEKVGRLNLNELKAQTEGQAHVFERANVHKVQMFHHGIDDKDLVENWRLNRMLKVRYPPQSRVIALREYLDMSDTFKTTRPSGIVVDAESQLVLDGITDAFSKGAAWGVTALRKLGADDGVSTQAQTLSGAGFSIGGHSDMHDLLDKMSDGDEEDADPMANYDPRNVIQQAAPVVTPENTAHDLMAAVENNLGGHLDDDRQDQAGMADAILAKFNNDRPQTFAQQSTLTSETKKETLEDVAEAILNTASARWIFSTLQAGTPAESKTLTDAVLQMAKAITNDQTQAESVVTEYLQNASVIMPVVSQIERRPTDDDAIRQAINAVSRKPNLLVTPSKKKNDN